MADEDVSELLSPEDSKNAKDSANRAWKLLQANRTEGDISLDKIRAYLSGDMDGPYMPAEANDEYRFLARRSTSNWLIPALNAPAQALFLEDHRLPGQNESSPAFQSVFRRCRLAGRQSDLYREAFSLDEAFIAVMVDEDEESPHKGLAKPLLVSRYNGVALYVDPANDIRPTFFLFVQRDPVDKENPGYGLAWDREHLYDVKIEESGENPVTLSEARPHGCLDTPVTSFTPYRDLLGRPRGLIRPLIPIQDRINQTIFDLMLVQSYGAFKVKYIIGMVPPTKKDTLPVTLAEMIEVGEIDPEDPRWEDVSPLEIVGYKTVDRVDSEGNPVPESIVISPSRTLIIEDPQAKVGSIQETPLDGYIMSIKMSVQHLAAIAQVPPQFLLGDISNLSADALAALAAALDRMVDEFQHSFGEAWCQVFQDVATVEGLGGADEYASECVWRDLTSRSLSQTVDALGKAVQMLGIPKRGMWNRFPGATSSELATWAELADEEARQANVGTAGLNRSTSAANRGVIASTRAALDTAPEVSDG